MEIVHSAIEKLSRLTFSPGNAVKNAGKKPEPPAAGIADATRGTRDKVSFLQIATAAVLITPILARRFLGLSPYTVLALSFLFILTAGWSFHKSAARNLIWRSIDADAFISFSLWAAFARGAAPLLLPRFIPLPARGAGMDLPCALAAVSIFSLWFVDMMESRSGSILMRLSRLPPKTARILDSTGEKTVPIDEVPAGAIIHVKAGEQVPIDGSVVSGSSLVDETIIRGSCRPLEKSEGAYVLAGSINKSDSLWLRTQKAGNQSELNRIAHFARFKSIGNLRLFGFADNAAALSLPLALISALTLAMIWAIDGPSPRPVWACVILFSVLSVACPCAIALGEPLAAWFGLRQGRKSGIKFHHFGALVRMNRIDALLVGKSEVLSLGAPSVVKIVVLGREAGKKARAAALSIAESSLHPISQAVVAHLRNTGAEALALESLEIEEGCGVAAKIGGKIARLGSLSWLKACGIAVQSPTDIPAELSILGFSWGEDALLAFVLQDDLRNAVAQAVARMKKMGIETILVSGDRNENAYWAAEKAGIGRVFAEALPDEKLRIIERLQAEGKRVAFLGRKFSDAAALSQADISFLSEPGSSPVSQDIADIVLKDGDISRVAQAFVIGSSVRRIARENVFWTMGVNAILLPAAAGILYPYFGLLIPESLVAAVITAQIIALIVNSGKIMKRQLEG